MVKLKCFLILFIFPTFSIFAQTAAEMDKMLETDTVTAAASARFILDAAELLTPGFSGAAAEKEAYDLAFSKGWVKGEAGETITLRDTAFLIMNAFGFKGGVMYSMFQNPRYAYRELIYRKIIQGRSDPAMQVTGKRLLLIIGSALSYSGENERLDAEQPGGDS